MRIDCWKRGAEPYPEILSEYPEPPRQLFARGDPAALDMRRVAIIGTRRCTAYGRRVAWRMGAELAEAGVAIVSGLALGIDGAAHEGCLEANGVPIGVVGSGLDWIYPKRHTRLWNLVAERGLLLSEFPAGTEPKPPYFPKRNRIIAGLAELVVVVESGEKGGSQHTVNAAIARDIDVMAVPGPVGATTSSGTNRMLADGIPPALSADDVLLALGMRQRPAKRRRRAAPEQQVLVAVSPTAEDVLQALDFNAVATERLLGATGLTPGALLVALEELAAAGLASGGAGWWSRTPR